ncbi:hypothetical protein HPB48_005439 [Haemaphysalis longicornis]|uniref:Uncharacterized protein n=1 Tax=Haemaphysalis longicornis TaxID=44386 RepID=A0A9J6GE26_HAELO|nr:hypothetical protein HPB48_005439 [Haemaphysalis longicornis]
MGAGETRKLRGSKLCLEKNRLVLLANKAITPLSRTVEHWHCVWRATCFRGGTIDALTKLEEKTPLCAAQVTMGGLLPSHTSLLAARGLELSFKFVLGSVAALLWVHE